MRGNAGGWEEQHLCLLSWSLKNLRRPASFWDRQRGKLLPAFEAWTGLAGPYRGQTHGLDGWKRSGSSRASVFKGCMPWRPWLCERWAFGTSLELCKSCLWSSFVSAGMSRSSRYHFLPRCASQAASAHTLACRAAPPAQAGLQFSLLVPITGQIQDPREPLVLAPSSLPNTFTPAGLSRWHTRRKGVFAACFPARAVSSGSPWVSGAFSRVSGPSCVAPWVCPASVFLPRAPKS